MLYKFFLLEVNLGGGNVAYVMRMCAHKCELHFMNASDVFTKERGNIGNL